MRFSARRTLGLLGLAVALALLPFAPVRAQTLEEEMAQEEGTSDTTSDTTTTTTSASATVTTTSTGDHHLSDEQAVYEERTEDGPVVSDTDPTERADTDYFFAGGFARAVIVPNFILDIFVQTEQGVGSTGTPVNGGGGGFFTWRRNGFSVTAEVWYLGFGASTYFHGQGAADSEFEFVESTLGAIFGNFLFGWSFDVTNWFGFDLGFGLGFGGMVGNLYRTEAYRDTATRTLDACDGPNSPPSGGYCEGPLELRSATSGRLDGTRSVGGTYQHASTGDPTIDARNGPNPWYFGDGGVPPIFFWLDLPRIGLRFKPIRQLQIRVDGGYNLYGFNVGGSIAYGF